MSAEARKTFTYGILSATIAANTLGKEVLENMTYEMTVFRCPKDPTEKHILKFEFGTERDRELTALSYIIYEENLKEILFTDPETKESRIYFKQEGKRPIYNADDQIVKDLIDSVCCMIDDLIESCQKILRITEKLKNVEKERNKDR